MTPADGTSNGLPVAALASFYVSDGQIDIMLANMQCDPRSVAQCLSGLSFTIKNYTIDPHNLPSVTAALAFSRTVNKNRTYTDGPTLTTVADVGWQLKETPSTGVQLLTVLDTPMAPQHTLIGPPGIDPVTLEEKYLSANSSILGGGKKISPHDPFLLGDNAFFTLSVPGLVAPLTPPYLDPNGSFFENVKFIFNTSAIYVTGDLTSYTPEPGTLGLLAVGGIGLLMRRNRRKAAA